MNNILHHDLELLCLSTLDILFGSVLIIIDRSTPVVVRYCDNVTLDILSESVLIIMDRITPVVVRIRQI